MKNILLVLASLCFTSPAFAAHEGRGVKTKKHAMMKKRSMGNQISIKNGTGEQFERINVRVVFQGNAERGYHRAHDGYIEIQDVPKGKTVKANLMDATVRKCHVRFADKNHGCTKETILAKYFGNDMRNVELITVRHINAGSLKSGTFQAKSNGGFIHPGKAHHGAEQRSFVIEGKKVQVMK
jgi:hypothetical protein